MFRMIQFFMLMSFIGVLFGAASNIVASTTEMIDIQGDLLIANQNGEIDPDEYQYRSKQADIAFRGSASAELEKVQGVIIEAEDVFNQINNQMNLTTQNTTMASGNFSEAIQSIQNTE